MTGTDGWILSVIVSGTVSDDEWILNPLIQLAHPRKKIFVIRSGVARDSLPTVSVVFLIVAEGSLSDLMIPRSGEPRLADAENPVRPLESVEFGAVSFYTPPFNWVLALAYWENWAQWSYGWIEDARHAPVLILLGKGWAFAIANPGLEIPMILITTVWIIRAFNIAFSPITNVTLDSAITLGRWAAPAADDFFECPPIARMAMVIFSLSLPIHGHDEWVLLLHWKSELFDCLPIRGNFETSGTVLLREAKYTGTPVQPPGGCSYFKNHSS